MNKKESKKYLEQLAYEKRLEYAKKHPKRNKEYAKMVKEIESKATKEKKRKRYSSPIVDYWKKTQWEDMEDNRRLKAEKKRKSVRV